MVDKVDKLVKRLKIVLEQKNYYEAHQISRTIYYRWLDSQNYQKLLEFLYTTCLLCIEAKEYTIALDLAELFVDTLQKSCTPAGEEVLTRFSELFSKLPSKQEDGVAEDTKGEQTDRRCNLLNKAVNWSIVVADSPAARSRGSPQLHLKLAMIFWSEGNYEAARTHFPVANAPEKFAEFLLEIQQMQPRQELDHDTLIAQTVFQMLCYKKLRSSVVVFQNYTACHPQIGTNVPFKSDLLNFIWLMLRSLYQRNLAYFTELVEHYQSTLAQDQNYYSYLDKIGQLYLGLPPSCSQSNAQGGFLGNILKELVGSNKATPSNDDLDEEDEFWDVDDDGFLTAPLPVGLLDEQTAADAAAASLQTTPSTSNKAAKEAEMDLD